MAAFIITSATEMLFACVCFFVCPFVGFFCRITDEVLNNFVRKFGIGIRSNRLNFEVVFLGHCCVEFVDIIRVHLTLNIDKLFT